MTKMAVSSSNDINTIIKQEPASSFENIDFGVNRNSSSNITYDSRISPENTNIIVKQEKNDFDLGPNNLIFDSRQRVYKIPASATTSPSQKRIQGRRASSAAWYKCQQCACVYETLAGCQSHIVVKHGEFTEAVND